MDEQFSVSKTSTFAYMIVHISGKMTISNLVKITSALNETNVRSSRDLVLEMSGVTFLDSSGIRLIINIHKKIDGFKKTLYIMNPSHSANSVLVAANLHKVLKIIDSFKTLEQDSNSSSYNMYLPYTMRENNQLRLKCICSVCESRNTIGYLIDHNNIEWRRDDNQYFPSSYYKNTNEQIDIYALSPIVCLDCFLCTTKISHFHVASESEIVVQAITDDRSKDLLTKSIKKRKKMAEEFVILNKKVFMYPRAIEAVYILYELAELCSRTITALGGETSYFETGYLNFILLKYSEPKNRDLLINNIRTWCSQALQTKNRLSVIELSMTYYCLLIANLSLAKIKETADIYNDFNALIRSLPETKQEFGITNPLFWYNQAKKIWTNEIENKAKALRL